MNRYWAYSKEFYENSGTFINIILALDHTPTNLCRITWEKIQLSLPPQQEEEGKFRNQIIKEYYSCL